jgi:hypothetical protein
MICRTHYFRQKQTIFHSIGPLVRYMIDHAFDVLKFTDPSKAGFGHTGLSPAVFRGMLASHWFHCVDLARYMIRRIFTSPDILVQLGECGHLYIL